MSVNKCKYSEKFRPLLTWMLQSGNSIEEFVQEHFIEDVDTILEKLGAQPSAPTSSKIVTVIDRDQILVKDVDEESKLLSILPGDLHDQVKHNVKVDLVKSLIYDPTTSSVVDLNYNIQGHSGLNIKLFEYQAKLLNDLRSYLGEATIPLNVIPTDSEWNKLVVDTVTMFENQPKADSVEYKQANLNYAKLKYFDSFIAVDSPYIQIDPKYKHKPAIDKYTLQIKSRHYTGNTGFNHKFEESMELASELATTLMDMIPEVDVSGANIVGSRIGKDEFFADAGKIISAIKNNDFEEFVKVRHNLFNKNLEDVNIEELIDAYIKIADKITKPEQKIYNLNKLYGIKKHLFSPKFSLEIKNLLKKYFLVNIPINYYAYDWDPTNGFGATLLSQKMTNSETGNFIDTVLAMIDHWRKSQSVPFRIENNTITFGNNKELVIAYNTPKDTFKFTVTKGNKETILKYVNEVLMYNPYNHFEDYFNNYYNSKNDDLLIDAWGNILGLVALGVNNKLKNTYDGLGDVVDLKPYYPMLKTIGDINALVLNIQSNSVVKNPEGNNLPTSILPNLANKLWEQRMFIKQFELSPFMNPEEISEFLKFMVRWGGNPENTHIYANNLIYNGSVKVGEPRVRSSVKYKNQVKNPDKLTLSEVLTVSIIDDFWNKLQDDSKDYISLQHATFADKTQHFIIDYDISNSVFDGKSIKELLKDGNIEALEKIIFDVRNKRYTQLATNILNDYRKAFPEETFNSLLDIDTFLKKTTLDKLQIAFNKAEIVLQDQIHYIGKKDKLSFNETIINYVTTFSNIKLTKARLNREKLQFIQNLKDEHFTILRDRLKGIDKTWINQYGEMILSKDGKINPILERFFYADALLSNEYTNLLIGDIYSHPSKHKDNNEDSDEEFLLFSEASRLIAQIKRTVIPGATYQPFVQKKDGVSDLINVAIINDFAATVMNIMGVQKSNLDSMDGSGLASPYQVWLENNSLVDGKLNKDRKTIMHGLDPIYGKQMLLKWAVFEISNERRRISYNSDIKLESLFKRMHDRPIINGLNGIIETFIQEWSKINTNNPIYFRHPKSEFVFKLINLKLEDTDDGKTYLVREIQPVDEHNQSIGNVIYDKLETGVDVKSLYDLDQVLGGAFNYTYDQNLGLLIPSDNNIEIVAKTIVEHNLKNHFIGYLVNKSAIKSGAGNINPDSHFQNEEPFTYLSFPSQFGGVQLDADHSVEYAEVTEMTQLISALIQKGYSRDVVRRIYSDIGETIVSSVKEFNDALNSKQADKVYRILGKALLESFAKGDKDSIGLAKTFVSIAQQFLNEEKIDFKIPFSAATVYPQFISVVTSNLVKSGIRRKYSGLISILVPSHGMIQYYELNGTKYDYTELAKLIKDKGIVHYIRTDKGIRPISIDEARFACFDKKVDYVSALDSALNDANVAMMVDGEIKLVSNPFIVEVDKTDVDFEDVVTVINTSTGEVLYDKQKISKYEQRDEIRNLLSDGYVITKHLLSPKNLKASDLTFEVEGKKYSAYDLDIVRTNHYVQETIALHELSESVEPKDIIDLMPDNKKTVVYWALNNNIPTLNDLKNQSFTQYLQAKTQEAITDLKNGVISEQVAFGKVNWDFISKQALLLNNFPQLQLTSPAQAQSYANSIGGINTLRQKKTNKHFGNPFSHTNYAGVQVIVPTVRDAAIAYDEWLRGVNYQEIEPERRKWIIDQIISGNLVGKPLVYYTDIIPDDSYGVEKYHPVFAPNHAHILQKYIYNPGLLVSEIHQQTNTNVTPQHTFISDLIKSVYKITNLKTQAAQLAIGKMYASKFLLRTGDKISQITGPKFFKNRLSELYDVDKYRLNDYDYVFFDNDKNPIFVTIASDAEFEQLYSDATLNTDFKNIDGTIYYKDKEFSSNDENISYWKVDSELGPVTMVKLNSIDQLEVLQNNYDLKMPRPNFTNRNFNILFPYIFKDMFMEEIVKTLRKYSNVSEETWLQELKNPTNVTVNYLNGWIKGKFNVSKTRLAEQMYKSWEIQKKLIGTRIPTQGMQSFMEMEIAIITDSDVNDVYVPAQQTFLQGSDYDIDKLFLLGWEIGDDGIIITGSRLDRFYNPLDVLDLPTPKHRHFELVTTDDADFILTAEHCEILKNEFNQKEHIAILREALLAGPKIKLEDAVKSEEWIANEFIFNLNLHDNTKSSNRVKEQVLKNKVVSGIHKVMSDAENIINATAPIEMEEQQAAAANSTAGKLVKRITSDNPFSKYLMQIQNMVGKEVIGISATGLKAYFALVNFYQNEFDKLTDSIINNDINSVLSILDKVIFTDVLTSNDSNTEVTTIANLNFDKLLKILIDKNITTLIVPSEHYNHLLNSSEFLSNIPDNPDAKLLNIRGLIEFLSKRSNRMDAALTHSGFLSAATDNAKELILKKVNADAKFAGVYAYLISTGHSFTEIAEFMKQPIFDEISRLSESNIFIDHTSNFSVDNALDWMLSVKPIVSSWSILAKIVEQAGIKSDGIITTYKKFENFIFKNIDAVTDHVVSHLSSIYKSNVGFNDFDFDNQDYYSDDMMYWDSEPEPEYSEDESGSFRETEITLTDKHYKDALAYLSLLNNKRRILTQSNTAALKKLKEMRPFTDEMKLLGKILKINQNIEGKSFEKYNYIRSIEKGINKIIQWEFSLIEFLLNETYRNTVINVYDEAIKRGEAQFNILQLIVDSSHFGEMFKLIALDKQLSGSSAIRSRITDGLANTLEGLTKNPRLAKLTVAEYKGLEDFVNDVLIYNYFTNRQDPLIINISGKPIKLNSIFGIGKFMKYVNSTIIPNIKKDYSDNDFAKTLTKGRRVNKYTGKSEYFWNLNINFNLRNKNDEINDKFQKVKNAFLEISNNVINSENPDWTLGDILFLYNLFVNKDKFGKNSFSSLFQDMVVNKISPLINDFYNTLAKWDDSATIEDFNFNIDDLIFRVIDKNNSIIDQSKFAATIVNNKITVGRYKTILMYGKPKIVVDRELIRSLEYNSEENIFNMPFMNPNAPIKTKPKKNTNVNSNMSTSTFLTNLITHINAMFSSEQELIKAINNQDALDKTNSYNGYIDQGTVYVNVQSPEHLLHELSHVALAIIKNNSPEKYYKLLSNIKQSEMYKTLNTSGVYDYLRGADFLEEVLVKELELYLSGQITNWTNSHEKELETIFSEQPVELLDVLFPDASSDFQFIIPEMKEALRSMTQSQSELQRILQESQMLLNLKARLFKGYQKNKQQIKLNANCK